MKMAIPLSHPPSLPCLAQPRFQGPRPAPYLNPGFVWELECNNDHVSWHSAGCRDLRRQHLSPATPPLPDALARDTSVAHLWGCGLDGALLGLWGGAGLWMGWQGQWSAFECRPFALMQVFSFILANQTSAQVAVWWSYDDGKYVKTPNFMN